jgi:hypothetical protein
MNAITIPAGSGRLHRGGDEGGARSRRAISQVDQALPSSGEQHGCRDAHAASAQGTRDSRQAVAGSDGIMLVSGMPARTRRVRRRIALRWCRHKVSQPCPGRI